MIHHYCDNNKEIIITMSFFGKMFGGKTEKVMTTGEAIQSLRETENMLIKKQAFLEKKIDEEIETARKNGSKNKRGNGRNFIFINLSVKLDYVYR